MFELVLMMGACYGCGSPLPEPGPSPQPNQCVAAPGAAAASGSNLLGRMEVLIDRIRVGVVVFDAIGTALDAADLVLGTTSATLLWGRRDISRYNQIGLHVVNPNGSIIPWQVIQVDWCRYGAPDNSIDKTLGAFVDDGR